MEDDLPHTFAAPSAVDGSPASTSLGVAVLRHGTYRVIVDTSLLLSPHQSVNALTGLSTSRLQFEIDQWYQVIGDMMLTNTVSKQSTELRDLLNNNTEFYHASPLSSDVFRCCQDPAQPYIRARVCRHLDDSFDLELYEETIKLRRKMDVQQDDAREASFSI